MEEAKARWPLMNAGDVVGAVWSPDDGRVSPSDLCAALVKGARARGVRIHEDTRVTGILTAGGRITGVETDKGVVRCDAVALCTGLWSRKVASMANVEVPVWPCEHFYLLTEPIDGIEGNVPSLSDHDGHLYIRDDSGGLLIGCFEPGAKPIDPDRLGEDFAFQLLPEDWDHFEPMMRNALHRLPALETAGVKMLLNGPESFTPDGAFMLGEAAETRGFFLGCGMNSVGVATGGGAGMALAHCIVHGHAPMDLHEVDPKRFPVCFHSAAALADRAPEVLGKHYEITYPGASGRRAGSSEPRRSTAGGARRTRTSVRSTASNGRCTSERPRNPSSRSAGPRGSTRWAGKCGRRTSAPPSSTSPPSARSGVAGRDAEAFLDRLCTSDMSRPPGRAVYTLMLNERGGIESDLVALRLDETQYRRLYVGTGAIKRDLAWLRRHLTTGLELTLDDETEAHAVLALTGPEAARIAESVGAGALNGLGYFRHGETRIAGVAVRGARLSYVGEAGWEITCPHDRADAVYEALHAAGARPCGVLAQTSMRIEKRFLAYGHDLDTDITPFEAGLEFPIRWDKDFIGRTALPGVRDRPRKQSVVTIVFDDIDAVPLGGEPVYVGERIAGKTTSAAFGYRIGKPVALALIDPERLAGAPGWRVDVDIAGSRAGGVATFEAAFDPGGTRMRPLSGN